jgi:glycosyltransferase involved in cell wall biosynthesis
MIEALACGTPVVAFPEGAAPEIVEHGTTGYLCQDEADMAVALCRIAAGHLDRAECRAAVERRFSVARLVDHHRDLYQRVLATGPTALATRCRHVG